MVCKYNGGDIIYHTVTDQYMMITDIKIMHGGRTVYVYINLDIQNVFHEADSYSIDCLPEYVKVA